jgi:hypothetical protein
VVLEPPRPVTLFASVTDEATLAQRSEENIVVALPARAPLSIGTLDSGVHAAGHDLPLAITTSPPANEWLGPHFFVDEPSTLVAETEVLVANVPALNRQPTPMTGCEQLWQPLTHMTRQEWAETCRRRVDDEQAARMRRAEGVHRYGGAPPPTSPDSKEGTFQARGRATCTSCSNRRTRVATKHLDCPN